ncbi:hypothetical protein TBLA_0H00140 [Henningerozyma blattae CBS 6284]|uniref:J domain-containing protein n=1 Tax=Henningerozyma blattae (strain ATCC 34711 / CBS 6284 / DSM 70876 / NBRC 10599 / NRRL Y-10934 / UCD 77-7) TaxID=1071380 RepID=I2H7F5_HENB6|nr:hypothetical protein TBLA_0H00140 [Tetrapisispora blattae CBS 6284]CCH62307.1 hypothetical protein TBLA_0H00140 [Tetrapisispora blattae CBS 6284]
MVLPIIIGTGVTILSITIKCGLSAWVRYKSLSPQGIAILNNIKIMELPQFYNDYRFISSRLNPKVRQDLDIYMGGFGYQMTEKEALLILNIKPNEVNVLNQDLLKKKHRLAIVSNHPDRGGSPYLALKINEAKEILKESPLLRN